MKRCENSAPSPRAAALHAESGQLALELREIPEIEAAVVPHDGQPPAVGAEPGARGRGISGWRPDQAALLAGGWMEQIRLVVCGDRNQLAIGGEADERTCFADMLWQRNRRIPLADRHEVKALHSGRRKPPPVRAERDRAERTARELVRQRFVA